MTGSESAFERGPGCHLCPSHLRSHALSWPRAGLSHHTRLPKPAMELVCSPSSPLSEHTPQLEAPQSGCCSCRVPLVVPTEMSPGPLLSHDALHLAYENYHPPLLPQAAHPLKASQPGSPFILLSAPHLPSEQASSLEHPTREQPGAVLLRIIALSPVAAETSGSESIHQGIVI